MTSVRAPKSIKAVDADDAITRNRSASGLAIRVAPQKPASEAPYRHGLRWLGMMLEGLCRGREAWPVDQVHSKRWLEHGRNYNPDPAADSEYQCFVRCGYDESDWARTGTIAVILYCNTGIGVVRHVPVGMVNQHRAEELIALIYSSQGKTDILLGDNRILGALKRAHQEY